MIKKPKTTLLKKDGKEYCVHPELKDDDIFQITATGIEHGFKTIYQKDFTFEDLKAASKYYSKFEDIESISNDIIRYLDKKEVELANRGDTIELYINISPEEEICLVLNKIFVDAELLRQKNEELLKEILQLQASINLLKEDLEKKIQGLKDSNKLANKLKKEKDELDRRLRELEKKFNILEKNLREKDELIGELEEDVDEYKKVNQNLSAKCERLEGELSENPDQSEIDKYKLKLEELEEKLKMKEDQLKENEENEDEKLKNLRNKLLQLQEQLKKQKELNKKLKSDHKAGDDELLKQLEELQEEYEKKIKELEDDLQKQIDLNKKLRENQKSGNEDFLKQIEEMEEEYQNKLNDLEAQLDRLKQENKRLKSNPKLSDYENKISELEEMLAKQLEINKQLKQKMKNGEDDKDLKIEELENIIKKLKEQLLEKDKTPEYDQLKSELNKLRGQIRQKDKVIDSLQSVRKDFDDKEKRKKIRKTSITKIITKTKRIRNLGTQKYISTTPTKSYKFLLSSDNKPIIKTLYNSVTKVQNGYVNSQTMSEQKRESLQYNDTNETEDNSYVIKSKYTQNKRNYSPVFSNINNRVLSENEVIETSDVIERENELDLIKDKLGISDLNLVLLYKATRDGDDAEIFHAKVDNIKNNITFIKTTQGVRFGGYTSQSWDGVNVFKEDDQAFVFSLTKLKTYDVNQKESAIWCYPNYGPVFEGYQIDIFDRFLLRDLSKTGLRGLGYNTTQDYELNNGEKNFLVEELEVYGIQ